MVEMVDTLDLGSRFWGFDSLFPYKKNNDKNGNSIIYNLSIIIHKLGRVV